MKSILEFHKAKTDKEKFTMITCYDYWSAVIINETDIDCILVGDSLAMVMHGFPNTIPADVDLMALHTAAVARGATKKFIVGDLPFLSFRYGLDKNMEAIHKLMRAGAQAVKLEGAQGNLELVRHVAESGVPVMGHLGLTPQSVHAFGGFHAQGKEPAAVKQLRVDAKALADAGCFSLVLECIPNKVAEEITHDIGIPTIGIGAGPNTDGQVLVLQDMLGMNDKFKPKFLKTFCDGFSILKQALNDYDTEVKRGEYPDPDKHCY